MRRTNEIGKTLGLVATVIAILQFGADRASATEPQSADVECLANVLRSAPASIAVEPAQDWAVVIDGHRTIRRGVAYTFRQPGAGNMTAGIYLATEWTVQSRKPKPHEVFMAGSLPSGPANNGRFAIILRPPYPARWYPPGRYVSDSPNGSHFVRQDSADHPLFNLWDALGTQCHAYNDDVTGASIP